jgi:dTDP-4-amino-4,6-dideoxygalactose transaminase
MIPFNKPFMTGKELHYIAEAHARGVLAGDGDFTKRCNAWLKKQTGVKKALLTHSCTAALEMAALLLGVRLGDEVIMPSYTFVSTANAFVLRGGVPVFVDIREDTLNLNECLIEAAITPRTKAIVPVHYAGVGCEMDSIMAIAKRHELKVVEDAAQGVMASYKGRALGSIGDLGAYSFHETKNIISGEGGSLLVNDPQLVSRAEIIREKGTDRSRFFRGEVDKYTWQEVGSSFLPGELISAFLWAQMEEAQSITRKLLQIWQLYHEMLNSLEQDGYLTRPTIPQECSHNAHMYYIVLSEPKQRGLLINHLREKEVNAVFHYIPLHSSPAGRKCGRVSGLLDVTTRISESLLRLPMYVELGKHEVAHICEAIQEFFKDRHVP